MYTYAHICLLNVQVGGVMSYSTCSLNPLEDEAVVAAILARTDGAMSVLRYVPARAFMRTHIRTYMYVCVFSRSQYLVLRVIFMHICGNQCFE